MPGFDPSELLPFYLDETDEQIAALNDALLKLEQDPSDAPVLREAFRMVHCIKGSSTVMGYEQVKSLTHHLETYFELLRSGERALDRATLELSFRCLDGLRDFHRQLRSSGAPTADLSGLTSEVITSLERSDSVAPAAEPEPAPEEPATSSEAPAAPPVALSEPECLRLTIAFVPNLPWPDMKAKLVLTRLSSKARVLATEPAVAQIETAETLPSFQVWVSADASVEELRTLADVEGVAEIRVEPAQTVSPLADSRRAIQPEAHVDTARAIPPRAAGEESIRPSSARKEGPSAPISVAGEDAHVSLPRPAEELPDARRGSASDGPTPAPAPETRSAPKKVAETLRVDVDRLDSLMNLAGELVINRARFHEIVQGLQELFRDSNARLLTEDTGNRLEMLGRELDAYATAASCRADDAAAVERWAAQLRRLRDNFSEIRRELDLIRHGREQVTALLEAIHQLGRVTDGLQKGVLDTRMVPIGPLFERFHRVVRDLRVSSGKEVVLKIDGEKTELDKRMIDELGDPLIHLVRNSVDHGLESPDVRERSGKPRAGTVSLQAMHRGNSVVVTVSDDGRGIEPDRVRRKAVERGLVSEDEAARLSDRQTIQYIWHPGFSTAEAVTDISGRGVGMDIVRARIEGLNGTVDVRTEPGVGTTFSIRLPLTLAILPCLLFRIFDEVYAIPLDHIDEIVEVDEGQVYEVRGRRMIEIRDRLVSLAALDDILTWSCGPRRRPAAEGAGGKLTVVVAHNGETTIGLLVDHLIGMQEVVLKSLEKNFRPVASLSGASILGDGRVSLILDVDALITMIAGRGAAPQAV